MQAELQPIVRLTQCLEDTGQSFSVSLYRPRWACPRCCEGIAKRETNNTTIGLDEETPVQHEQGEMMNSIEHGKASVKIEDEENFHKTDEGITFMAADQAKGVKGVEIPNFQLDFVYN